MITPRSPFIAGTLAAFLTGGLLAPAVLGAQSPWTVTVTPTLNPLPIGFCGAVQLTLVDPSTRDTPRNPRGARVTIADFDMTVTSPDGRSVAGHQVDASHWSACACSGASVGTVATITATYPARSIARDALVPGVAFQATATFGLGASKGSSNPPACTADRGATVATAAATATTVPPPPPPVVLPNQPARGAPLPPPAAGKPPRTLAIAGTPAEALVTWWKPDAQPGPASYLVERWNNSNPACCRVTQPMAHKPEGTFEWRDPVQGAGTWTYQVTAIYADGSRGVATGSYVYPDPETPKGLTAQQTAKNTVMLSWQPVNGASYYAVSGPPTNTAIKVTTTTLTRTGLPLGNTNWQVAAMYDGSTGAQQGSAFATTNLTVVNPQYRLVAEAIRVTTETVDAPLSGDGMYDEIYVASFAERHLRPTPATSGQLLEREPVRLSAVHGDISNWLPMERVQAGTASASGGVKGGDIVSPVLSQRTISSAEGNFVFWEGELIPGKHDLVLRPTIWEVDQPTSDAARVLGGACITRLCNWAKNLSQRPPGSQLSFGQANPFPGTQITVVDGDIVWLGTTGPQGSMVHLERHDQDRPVGLEVRTTDPNANNMGLTGNWRDKAIILSSEKIEAAFASGTNRIEVRFWDHWNLPNTPQTKVNYLNGDYTLVIRIERVP